MGFKKRSPLLLVLLFLFLSSGLLHCFAQSLDEAEELEGLENGSWADELEDDEKELMTWNQQDPARRQYQQCQQRCQRQPQGPRQQQCQQACQQQFERRRQQRQQCQQQCQGRRPQERQQCQQRCQRQIRQQQPEYSLPGENQGGRSNPYYFDLQSFLYRFQSQAGHFRVLPRLTDVRPQLFESLRNYRLAVLVAHPQTFVQPHYRDASSVLIVTQGNYYFVI